MYIETKVKKGWKPVKDCPFHKDTKVGSNYCIYKCKYYSGYTPGPVDRDGECNLILICNYGEDNG